MSGSLHLPKSANRAEIYAALLPQIESIISGEQDLVANQANIVAALREAFGFFWIGFYWVKPKSQNNIVSANSTPTNIAPANISSASHELVLGPFQGPIACTRIAFNRGVCGHAYTTRKSVLVPNVDEFPGHIACSSASRSEVVIPVMDPRSGSGGSPGAVLGVLDVDSDRLNDFSEVDVAGLEAIVAALAKTLS